MSDTTDPANGGASNIGPAEIIRRHLNGGMKGPFWDAIIAALAAGDQINWDNARAAFDQLFMSTASDFYLDRKAGDYGVVRPSDVGMSDDLFRKFAISTTATKLTLHSLNAILEVFYGSDALRAHCTTQGITFALTDGSDLWLLFDEKDVVHVVFHTADFNNIAQASALEIAAVITRACRLAGLKSFAVQFSDPVTGNAEVRIYSASLGLGSSVRVTAGTAQNQLKFPTVLLTQVAVGVPSEGVQPGQNWVVTIPSFRRMRVQLAAASLTTLAAVRPGDYVNISGANFASANRGSFPVLAVDVRYVAGVLTQFFEVMNVAAVAQNPVATVTQDDILFFRPTKATIQGSQAVIVTQSDEDTLQVILPATTQAVTRHKLTGAYIQGQPTQVPTSVTRVGGVTTASFPANHGVTLNQMVLIDGVYPSGSLPATSAGNGTTTSDARAVTIWSTLAQMSNAASFSALALLLADGGVFIAGGTTGSGTVTNNSCKFAISATAAVTTGGKRYTYAWAAKANMPVATGHPTGAVLIDANQSGNVLVCGGDSTGNVSGSAGFQTSYIYNVGSNTWSSNIPMVAQRSQHAVSVLPSFDAGKVVATGGSSDGTNALATVEVFTPSATGGSWAAGASMVRARACHTSHTLSDGRVIVIGGRPLLTTFTGTLPHCEVYDPIGNTWVETSPMSYARAYHHSLLLPNAQILVVGGTARPAGRADLAGAAVAACEVYDVASGRWNPFPNAPVVVDGILSRMAYVASLNRVYLSAVGGPSTVTFWINLTERVWHRSPAVSDGRTGTGFVALTNGTILSAGGADLALAATRTSMLLDPESEVVGDRGMNGYYRVTAVPTSSSLQFQTLETSYTDNSNTPVNDPNDPAFIRPATAVPST